MGYLKASAISLASTCLALGAASAQAPAEPVRYSAEAFYDTTSFVMASPAGYGFSADGQAILISSDNSGVFNTRSEEHTSELQSLMRISYAVFCLKKKKKH